MFSTFANAWRVPDLRKRMLFTLFIIIVCRIGSNLFVPFLKPEVISNMISEGSILNFLDQMTGGALGKGTLFAMSITPYINASIIMQLMTTALPPLERLSKEGDEGRKIINKITRFVALGIALFQASAFYIGLRGAGAVRYMGKDFSGYLSGAAIVLCFVAGASLIVWLGDRIMDSGLGNGVSIILFSGIVSRLPHDISRLVKQVQVGGPSQYIYVPIVILIFCAMITLVVLIQNSERRLPVMYAKRTVGRKQYGGQSSNIPIKVAMSGIMPIIFAMSVMSMPSTIMYFFGINGSGTTFGDKVVKLFYTTSLFYGAIYFVLIIAFNYFYVAMQYNPVEIANNLQANQGSIPGYRPGKPTADLIYNSLSKITLIGAIFLAFIAIFPIAFQKATGVSGLSLGGTTMLILVNVVLETLRQMESQMVMRHHKGFLDS